MQVNPHFLYNTLDNICALAELDEKETLIQLVMNLSSFYRSSLSNGKMHISIGQELEISRAYLEILQIRYFHKFDFTITCPEALKNYSCIKLLLQPILENSIYHGIKGLTGTESFILRRKILGIVSGLRFQTTGVDFQKKTMKKSGRRMLTTLESKVSSSEFCSTTGRVMDCPCKVPKPAAASP